jgi:ubiquinone/menaquinone biosynthesis C-methylase UbiE
MPASGYDEIADWYDDSVRTMGSLAEQVARHVVALAGDVAGGEICDLACGQGLVARHLARLGARVTGIDLSAKLLEIARREELAQPLGIVYRLGDAQTLDGIPEATFDGVVCSLALMDIPDLAATFRAVRRVLRAGGWFVFSITHPCFQIPPLPSLDWAGSSYFAEGFWRSDYPHGVRGKVGAYHRMLSTYLNALSDASFHLERIIEPSGAAETSRRLPSEPEAPKFLIIRCGKE